MIFCRYSVQILVVVVVVADFAYHSQNQTKMGTQPSTPIPKPSYADVVQALYDSTDLPLDLCKMCVAFADGSEFAFIPRTTFCRALCDDTSFEFRGLFPGDRVTVTYAGMDLYSQSGRISEFVGIVEVADYSHDRLDLLDLYSTTIHEYLDTVRRFHKCASGNHVLITQYNSYPGFIYIYDDPSVRRNLNVEYILNYLLRDGSCDSNNEIHGYAHFLHVSVVPDPISRPSRFKYHLKP